MNKPSRISLTPSSRAGLTLIEVIAAIAILGTVLVGIVMAKSRHTRQMALTQRYTDIVHATDDMVSRWWLNERSVPAPASGHVGEDTSITWQTRLVASPKLRRLDAEVVRLEVFDTIPAPGQSLAADEPVVVLEFVVPFDSDRHADANAPANPAGVRP